ncbi:hypothetical protein Ahy_B07g088045 [Arachis hypogaea]|uniref:Uncharacterized protein n=1 Tax=Arachis hypogaea TaxID=3818 RepID=A0A444YDJ1_ARAHY|nr:hypothetical protein Ahy_B07g088045 [Arachis hypogaea]
MKRVGALVVGLAGSIKLVWSPLETCGLLSNWRPASLNKNKLLRGGAGSKYEAVVYAAGPLVFCPSHLGVLKIFSLRNFCGNHFELGSNGGKFFS